MKAAVLYGNEDIRYVNFETPNVTSGTVKVAVKDSGICGSDVPRVLHNGAHFYPIVLGHEFSGEVVEVGADVSTLKVGDRVSGAPLIPCLKCPDCQKGNYALCKNYSFIGSRQHGSFAEYVVLPEHNAIKFAENVSWEQGAFFEPSSVALHGVFCNDFKGGGNVAILGGGTVGLFTAQWCKILGAKKVVVFDICEERLGLARKLGAHGVVNTLKPEFKEDAEELIESEGFNYVFETAGNTTTMNIAFEIAGNKANVCFIGTPHSCLSYTPNQWENMNRKEFKLTGSWMSYSAPYPGKEWGMTAYYFGTGQLKIDEGFIFKKFHLSEVDKAFSLFKDPTQVKGKVLLVND